MSENNTASARYTLAEIDNLRTYAKCRYLYGTYQPNFINGSWSRSYSERDLTLFVEETVRTWMMAGVRVEDFMEQMK